MENTDHYVYIHRRLDNNIVFYVGHGRLRRKNYGAKTKTKDWLLVNNEAKGYTVEIIANDLSKEQAFVLEKEYILNPPLDWQLINKRLPVENYELSYEYLSKKYEYSEDSKTKVVFKTSRIKKLIGKDAGGIQRTNGKNSKCYFVIRDGKRLYLVHRLIWVLFNKKDIPKNFVIDHIDGNGLNNSISNLRILTQQENSSTRKITTDNLVGVYCESKAFQVIYWCAKISVNGKNISKKFSVKKFGEIQAKQMAIEKRKELELEFQPN